MATVVVATISLVVLAGCSGLSAPTDTQGPTDGGSQPVTVATSDGGSASVETVEADVAGDDLEAAEGRPGTGDATGGESDGQDEQDAELEERAARLAESLPSVAQLPQGRTADEVRLAVARCVVGSYADATVASAEVVGTGHEQSQQTAGVEDYWASYLIELRSYGKIGIMVTCSSETEPMAHERDLLVVSHDEFYDVKAGDYRLAWPYPTYNEGDAAAQLYERGTSEGILPAVD